MAIAYKVLGQINPGANVLSTLYTVPSSTSSVVSTISICNQNAAATSVSIAVQPQGSAISPKNYIMYNTPIAGYDTITLTLGITLGNTDVLSANSFTSTVSFTAFGSEIS